MGRGLVWSGMEITDPKEFCEKSRLRLERQGTGYTVQGSEE